MTPQREQELRHMAADEIEANDQTIGELLDEIRATNHPMRIVEMTQADSLRSQLVSDTLACNEKWQQIKKERAL